MDVVAGAEVPSQLQQDPEDAAAWADFGLEHARLAKADEVAADSV